MGSQTRRGTHKEWYDGLDAIDQGRCDETIDLIVDAVAKGHLFINPVTIMGQTVPGVIVDLSDLHDDLPPNISALAPVAILIPHDWDGKVGLIDTNGNPETGSIPADLDSVAQYREEQGL